MKMKIICFSALLLLALGSLADEKNTPPTVKIESPEDGSKLTVGQMVTFVGSAVDLEDGEMSEDQMIWTSDVDKFIGKGKSPICRLSPIIC